MNNMVRIDQMQLFSPPKISTTRGQCKKVRKNFSQRVINNWNHLPPTTVEAPSLKIFENRLDEYWICPFKWKYIIIIIIILFIFGVFGDIGVFGTIEYYA